MDLKQRAEAVRIIGQVLSEHKALDEILIEPTPWLMEVCSGTLRYWGRIQLALQEASAKRSPTGWLKRAMAVGAYQVLFQDRTSPGAAVSETVQLITEREGKAPGSFANAVLRKLSLEKDKWRQGYARWPLRQRGAWASVPGWFWDRWVAQVGEEEAARRADRALMRPEIWIRLAPGVPCPKWAVTVTEGSPQARVIERGPLHLKSEFKQGQFIVQDRSNQIFVEQVTKFLNEYSVPNPEILDLCAAPGGKSIGLAWNGFAVTATDVDPKRVLLLKESITRTIRSIHGAVAVAEYKSALTPRWDVIWVDAPCSSSGLISRHPELRWSKTNEDVNKLTDIQRGLVRKAWSALKPGGFLIYSVCSIWAVEQEQVLKDALKNDLKNSGIFRLVSEFGICDPEGDGLWGCIVEKNQ